jgi:hypothetical protein
MILLFRINAVSRVISLGSFMMGVCVSATSDLVPCVLPLKDHVI